MNNCIQTLNDWGENFLSFAWPMLWQSSLLIAVVFTFDALFARRIRAAVRYALWLAVLVKLLLPPTLALPTGVAWWLCPAKPPLTPIINTQVVTYDAPITLPSASVPQTVPFVPPPPTLSGAGWTMLAVGSMDAALLLWLALRWLRVAAKVRRAENLGNQGLVPRPETARPLPGPLPQERGNNPPMVWNDERESQFNASMRDAEIIETLQEVCRLAGRRRCPRLKLLDDVQSPAVYGLFRPVILLPRALVEKLSARQLRAVLLHEAMHLRRGDVWMNCAQTLLQIAYWWHPLLWLANARIRRLREEAVDDAVMLTLRGDADAYAPTLLAVAKFSFRRPLASLALIGILESRSALRRRIERLVDFRPPRRAGLTFQALCGILVFCAVALPMGCGRQPSTTNSVSSGPGPAEKKLTMTVDPQIFTRNLKAQTSWTLEPDPNEALLDIMNGEGVDCTSSHEIAFNTKTGEITTQNTPEQLEIFRQVIDELNRADGKCALPLRSTTFHRKSVLIHGQFFWMTAEDLKTITSDATYHRKQGDNAAHWTADAKHFDQIQKRIKQLGMEPFTQPRIQTGHGMAAEMYIGNHTNWVDFECYPLIYDDGITLAFKAESDSVFMQDALQKTNRDEVDGRETLDNNGGMIISPEKANGSPTNLVLVINVKTVGETPTAGNSSFQQRLQAIQSKDSDNSVSVSGKVEPAGISVLTSPGRKAIYQKLKSIHVDTVSFQALPLSETIRWLRQQSQFRDPDKTGINFNFDVTIPPGAGYTGGGGPQTDPSTGFTRYEPENYSWPTDDTQINITLRLNHVSLVDLLNAICVGSDRPIKYSVEAYGVVFSAKETNSPQYEMRTFKIAPNAYAYFQKIMNLTPLKPSAPLQASGGGLYFEPSEPIDTSMAFKQYFSRLGIKLDPPKAVFFNSRLSILFVYATPKDLDVIERAIVALYQKPPPNQTASSGTSVRDSISEQTESGLNQALIEERKAAHMNLTAQAEATPSQTPSNPVINPVTSLPASIPHDPSQAIFLNNAPGTLNVLNASTNTHIFGGLIADPPPISANPNELKRRVFFVGTAAFSAAIREKTGETNALQGFRELIAEAGVDLPPPKNVSIMSERMGAIHVEATTNDLKTIAGIIADLHCPPPMVHIKARFIEVPKSFLAGEPHQYIPADFTNGVEVLPNPDFRVLLHEIEQQKGSEEIAEPEVTTICWRRTEMRATITQPFVTNYVVNLHPTNSADNIVPQICQVETGPILDVVPMGLQDGYTLDLQVIPSEVEFLGYADTRGLPKRTAIDSWGAKIELPNVLPLFKVYETTMQNKLYKLYDGQTLVLAPTARQVPPGMSDEKWSARIADYFHKSQKEEDKVLLVFVTATLMDEAGNRLHSDREMPFTQNHVPPQDPSSHPVLYHYPSQSLPFR